MNPKINSTIKEIERTKAKIAELQALLPELERKRLDMENTEIVRLVRSANIAPADLPGFVESLRKAGTAAVTVPQETHQPEREPAGDTGGGTDNGAGADTDPAENEEDDTDA